MEHAGVMDRSTGRLRPLGKRHNAVKPDYYYDHYEAHLTVDPDTVTAMLELGVHQGGSLLMWAEYFRRAQIFGVDFGPMTIAGDPSRIHLLQSDQTDTASIARFLRDNGVESLDVIIDDCSHMGFATKTSFEFLFDTFLKPGGYYVIEDWGTGYAETWPDGAKLAEPDPSLEPAGVFRSHDRGIPGFVKQLIDQTARYESIAVTGAFVVVKKQSLENAAAIERATKLWNERGAV